MKRSSRVGRFRIATLPDVVHQDPIFGCLNFPEGTIILRVGVLDGWGVEPPQLGLQLLIEHPSLTELSGTGPAVDVWPEYRVIDDKSGGQVPRFERVVPEDPKRAALEESMFRENCEGATQPCNLPTREGFYFRRFRRDRDRGWRRYGVVEVFKTGDGFEYYEDDDWYEQMRPIRDDGLTEWGPRLPSPWEE